MAERARPHAALTDPLDTRILRTNPGRKPPILPSYARWPCFASPTTSTIRFAGISASPRRGGKTLAAPPTG